MMKAMKRIQQHCLDEILEKTDIVDLIGERCRLVKKTKNSKDYFCKCPFHRENTPSFSVVSKKQFYYCFGCGAGGNAFDFLMDYHRYTFPEAARHLAMKTNTKLAWQ